MCPYVFIEWTELGVEWQKTGRATSCSKTAQILSTDVIQLNLLFLTIGKCLNYIEDSNHEISEAIFICAQEHNEHDCHGPLKSWRCTIDFTLVPVLMGLSIICLLVLLFVIWYEKKDKLYENMMMCNFIMLTLVYLTLIILKTSVCKYSSFKF